MPTLEVEVDGVWLREKWREFMRDYEEAFGDSMTEEELERQRGRERLLIRATPRVEGASVEGDEFVLQLAAGEGGDVGNLYVEARVPISALREVIAEELRRLADQVANGL